MKIKELKNKSEKELQALLQELREKLRVMRFKVAQRQLKKVHEVKRVKRDIARVLTMLQEIKKSRLQPSAQVGKQVKNQEDKT